MRWALLALIFAMIAKDTLPVGDVYILRGGSQLAAMLLGLWLILTNFNIDRVRSNIWVILYLFAITLSACFSNYFVYSSLQVASLAGPILLFLGLAMQAPRERYLSTIAFSHIVILFYAAVCLVSLCLWIFSRETVVQHVWGSEIRFTGLFSEPAMMGVAAGLLLGTAFFRLRSPQLKWPIVILACSCLLLTLSRTFILTAATAIIVVSWLYYPKQRKLIAITMILGGCLFAGLTYINSIKYDDALNETIRIESVENLSGRTALWEAVIAVRTKEPFSGAGFSVGGTILLQESNFGFQQNSSVDSARLIGKTTLHSGYIQALADLGILGLSIYFLAIAVAVYYAVTRDKQKRYPEILYILIFMSASNIGESVIYTASNFPSLYFWYAAIFASALPALRASNRKRSFNKVGTVV